MFSLRFEGTKDFTIYFCYESFIQCFPAYASFIIFFIIFERASYYPMLIVESESDSKSYSDNKSMRKSDVDNYV